MIYYNLFMVQRGCFNSYLIVVKFIFKKPLWSCCLWYCECFPTPLDYSLSININFNRCCNICYMQEQNTILSLWLNSELSAPPIHFYDRLDFIYDYVRVINLCNNNNNNYNAYLGFYSKRDFLLPFLYLSFVFLY